VNHPLLPQKDPDEILVYGIDFTRWLASDEVITSSVVTSELLTAAEDTTALELSGSPDFSESPIVKQRIGGGTAGNTYKITASVGTSLGQTHVGCAVLPVRAC
jgi:hypothetical protein